MVRLLFNTKTRKYEIAKKDVFVELSAAVSTFCSFAFSW